MSNTLLSKTLFEPLETVEETLGTLSNVDSYVDVNVFGVATEATSALAELGETLHEAAPFPRMGSSESATEDAIAALLQSRYEADGRAEEIDSAQFDRVETRGETIVIPLGRSGLTQRNWAPTLNVLRAFVEWLLSRAEMVVRRVRSVEGSDARDACRAIRRMLASVRDLLAWSVAGAQFVDRRADSDADVPISFASWASERLIGANDA